MHRCTNINEIKCKGYKPYTSNDNILWSDSRNNVIGLLLVQYPLFKCDWIDVHKKNGMKVDEIGFTMVNLKRCLSKDRLQDDPFILASQTKQVFYVQDPVENDWCVVLTCPLKGSRNFNRYDLEYADFEGTKCKEDEAVGDGGMDYVRQDCEGTWLDVVQ